MNRIFAAYSRFLTTHRYASQSITAGTLWLVGDIVSQKFDPPSPPAPIGQKNGHSTSAELSAHSTPSHSSVGLWGIDWKRTLTMTTFGFVFAGPAYTFWYRLLEDKIGGYFTAAIKKQHQKTVTMNISKTNLLWKVSIAKVIADIVLFDGPYLAFFFISTHLMSGSTFKSAIEHMKADILPTFFMDVIVWTPVQLANFRWIPVLYQPVLVNSVNVGWNAYLSYVKHREAPAKATSEK